MAVGVKAEIKKTKSKKRAKVEFDAEDVDNVLNNGDFAQLNCCGVLEFSGMNLIKNESLAKAIRRAAWLDSKDGDGGSGFVLASTSSGETGKQGEKDEFLKAGGFRLIKSFTNGRTGNEIHLWGATTLTTGPGALDDDDDSCNCSICRPRRRSW
jgi:hypothetical protein